MYQRKSSEIFLRQKAGTVLHEKLNDFKVSLIRFLEDIV